MQDFYEEMMFKHKVKTSNSSVKFQPHEAPSEQITLSYEQEGAPLGVELLKTILKDIIVWKDYENNVILYLDSVTGDIRAQNNITSEIATEVGPGHVSFDLLTHICAVLENLSTEHNTPTDVCILATLPNKDCYKFTCGMWLFRKGGIGKFNLLGNYNAKGEFTYDSSKDSTIRDILVLYNREVNK